MLRVTGADRGADTELLPWLQTGCCCCCWCFSLLLLLFFVVVDVDVDSGLHNRLQICLIAMLGLHCCCWFFFSKKEGVNICEAVQNTLSI